MDFQLKDFQKRTLEKLGKFLEKFGSTAMRRWHLPT